MYTVYRNLWYSGVFCGLAQGDLTDKRGRPSGKNISIRLNTNRVRAEADWQGKEMSGGRESQSIRKAA